MAHLAFTVSNFNPRPPCGGRLLYGIAWASQRQFQSTSSVWRTTKCRCFSSKSQKISIHVLRGEDDRGESDGRRPARDFNPRPPCGGRLFVTGFIVITQIFQSTSSVWRTTAKTEKNLYLHSYNTAICTDLQLKQSAYAFVCTDRDKQSPEKLVRSIRVRSARFTFARPSPPGEALRKSARHPDGRRGELRCVQPCFDNGCPAGKSAGCPLPGRSIWPVRP